MTHAQITTSSAGDRDLRPRCLDWGLAALLGGLILPATGMAQAVPNVTCDTEATRTASSGPQRYQELGNRCEGTFGDEVSPSGLDFAVMGFYRSFSAFGREDPMLLMSWDVSGTSLVSLRVRNAWEAERAYGMDTQLPPGTTSFHWPTDYVVALGLEPGDLATAAFLQVENQEVYLPLRIGPPGVEAADEEYTLTLRSREAYSEVRVTVAPVSSVGDRATGGFVVRNQRVEGDSFDSNVPFEVKIGGLETSGLYVARVVGLRSSGDPHELNVYFHHR